MASRSMPTGARLVAAVAGLFACLAMVYVLIAYLPEAELERRERGLLWIFGAVGVLHGWYGLGKRASEEGGSGLFLGIRSAVTVFVWIVFILALAHVIETIIDRDLVGAEPMEAIFLLFERMVLLVGTVMDVQLIAIFLGTGIVCGVLARGAARRWD